MNIEALRTYATALPNVEEEVKWGKDLCFCIGKKMFCVIGLEPIEFGASLRVQANEFAQLIEKKGIVPAPYLARYNWIGIQSESVFSEKEWHYYVKQSYELVKEKLPKKILKSLGKI